MNTREKGQPPLNEPPEDGGNRPPIRSFGKPSPLQSDTDLIAACLSGNLASWDALIARYQGFIFGLGLRLGLSRTDAEDVFQNVCVSLYQNLSTLRDSTRLVGWLATATRQEVSRLRRRRNVSSLSEIQDGDLKLEGAQQIGAEPTRSPEEDLLALEEQHLVRQCLPHLSDECRQLLTLLYGKDPPCSYGDVAEKLSMPVGSIGPKRARCLQRLKKYLEEFGF